MKKINVKAILLTCVVIVVATAQTFADNHNERQKQLAANLKVEKAAVNQQLANINQQQERINAAGKACKASHSDAEHRAYTQAKADLKKAKADLKDGKKKLVKAHQAHVKDHKDMIREERKVLADRQRSLDKSIVKGEVASLNKAESVMSAREERRELFNRLEHARLDRDKDMWVIDKEYKDNKAKTSLKLHMHDHSVDEDGRTMSK